MAGVNKVILLGNLGRDPEVRSLESGVKVATVSIATSESYKDQSGNWQDRTEWHRLVFWRGYAERAERLKKGDRIFVEGKLTTRSWEQDGATKYVTEIVVNSIQVITRADGTGAGIPAPDNDPYANTGSSSSTSSAATSTTTTSPDLAASSEDSMDDLPF